MGYKKTIVDESPPAKIISAILYVKKTPGLRVKSGSDALWDLYSSKHHTLKRSDLEKKFRALDAHFGWFCRRVAEILGDPNPDVFALVDYCKTPDGQLFVLKPSVAAAMNSYKPGTRQPAIESYRPPRPA